MLKKKCRHRLCWTGTMGTHCSNRNDCYHQGSVEVYQLVWQWTNATIGSWCCILRQQGREREKPNWLHWWNCAPRWYTGFRSSIPCVFWGSREVWLVFHQRRNNAGHFDDITWYPPPTPTTEYDGWKKYLYHLSWANVTTTVASIRWGWEHKTLASSIEEECLNRKCYSPY